MWSTTTTEGVLLGGQSGWLLPTHIRPPSRAEAVAKNQAAGHSRQHQQPNGVEASVAAADSSNSTVDLELGVSLLELKRMLDGG